MKASFKKPDPLLNERAAADYMNCSVYKLQSDRHYARGLPYLKLGKTVRYRLSDVEKYLDGCVVHPQQTAS